mgnify:CR=1 FL=1
MEVLLYLLANYLVVMTSYVLVFYLDKLILIGKLQGCYCSCTFSPKKSILTLPIQS